ncbi:MAG TPA: hypothetical protein VFZ71_04710 [Pyrinomonadaceae bacterium]
MEHQPQTKRERPALLGLAVFCYLMVLVGVLAFCYLLLSFASRLATHETSVLYTLPR